MSDTDVVTKRWQRHEDDSGWMNHDDRLSISDEALDELGVLLPELAMQLPHVYDLAATWYERRFGDSAGISLNTEDLEP